MFFLLSVKVKLKRERVRRAHRVAEEEAGGFGGGGGGFGGGGGSFGGGGSSGGW